MNRSIKSLLVAIGIAMLFSALSVGIVFAEGDGAGDGTSSETTKETRKSHAEEGRNAFAEALGVSVEELDAAFQQVVLDRVDAAVEDGKLTEEEASDIRGKIEAGEGKRWGGHLFKFGGSGGEALATALNVTVDDLAAARKQVALDRIDAAVEAGKLTEEKAEELRTAIESGEKLERGRGLRDHHKGSGKGWNKGDGATGDTAKTE